MNYSYNDWRRPLSLPPGIYAISYIVCRWIVTVKNGKEFLVNVYQPMYITDYEKNTIKDLDWLKKEKLKSGEMAYKDRLDNMVGKRMGFPNKRGRFTVVKCVEEPKELP
jgi:hypothetical protein